MQPYVRDHGHKLQPLFQKGQYFADTYQQNSLVDHQLPCAPVATFISKGTIFCRYVPAKQLWRLPTTVCTSCNLYFKRDNIFQLRTQSFQPPYHFTVLPRTFHSIFFHLIVLFIEKKCLRACFKIKNSLQQHPHAGTLTGGSFACSRVTSKKNSSFF